MTRTDSCRGRMETTIKATGKDRDSEKGCSAGETLVDCQSQAKQWLDAESCFAAPMRTWIGADSCMEEESVAERNGVGSSSIKW